MYYPYKWLEEIWRLWRLETNLVVGKRKFADDRITAMLTSVGTLLGTAAASGSEKPQSNIEKSLDFPNIPGNIKQLYRLESCPQLREKHLQASQIRRTTTH